MWKLARRSVVWNPCGQVRRLTKPHTMGDHRGRLPLSSPCFCPRPTASEPAPHVGLVGLWPPTFCWPGNPKDRSAAAVREQGLRTPEGTWGRTLLRGASTRTPLAATRRALPPGSGFAGRYVSVASSAKRLRMAPSHGRTRPPSTEPRKWSKHLFQSMSTGCFAPSEDSTTGATLPPL